MKKLIKYIISKIVKSLSGNRIGELLFKQVIQEVLTRTKTVIHNGCTMKFTVSNWLTQYRADSFSHKEPETLLWIENLPENSVLWDIGANVGLYSIYAAKARNCRVYAFEPSVFNLELLSRNIYLNNLQQSIVIVPVALSNSCSENLFRMSSTQWGGALSTYGENFDQNGNQFQEVFEYQTIGLPADILPETIGITKPDYIKMDVDGIEHIILAGAKKILLKVKGIILEINDDFEEQASISHKLLSDAGLTLVKKFDERGTQDFHQYNQLWERR